MSAESQFITLVSTGTIDRLPSSDGPREVPGGPARYVGEALDRLGYSYRLITGATAIVDVLPRDDGGEEYVIAPLPSIPLPRTLAGDAVILSPIGGEIDPRAVPATEGLLAIDLQGFVRIPGQPTNRLASPAGLSGLLARADLIKGSTSEFGVLTERDWAAAQEAKVAITHGSAGVEVRFGAERVSIEPEPVRVADTIGAGDNFLAAFTVYLLRGLETLEAARSAMRFTERMLRKRST